MGVHSFDRPTQRPVPLPLTGVDVDGRPVSIHFARRTVVLAVKANCGGCRDFLAARLAFEGFDVVLVSAAPMPTTESAAPIVVAGEWMARAGLVAAPSYTVIDPLTSRVITEGVAFAPAQVAQEIATHLG